MSLTTEAIDAMDLSESPTMHLDDTEPLFGYHPLLLEGSASVTAGAPAQTGASFSKADSPGQWTDVSAEDEDALATAGFAISPIDSKHAVTAATMTNMNPLFSDGGQTGALTATNVSQAAALMAAAATVSPASSQPGTGCYSSFLGGFNLMNISPYSQAIPALARRCLSFTNRRTINDGEMSESGAAPFTAIEPTLDELLGKGMQIRVLGVAQTGAKSRVETQIKICIQLVTSDGEKVIHWPRLRLPEHMVARDCWKLRNSKSGLNEENPTNILDLDVAVVCSSDTSRRVFTCVSCVQRERKRTLRKKENRRIREELEQAGKTDIIDLKDKDVLERERSKIVLFNCNQLLDFTSGGTILPTRITCYCRHHTEKKGFRINFTVRDHTGKEVATGSSPPIMITDDHKASKKDKDKEIKSGSVRRKSQCDYVAAKEERDIRRKASPSSSSPTPPVGDVALSSLQFLPMPASPATGDVQTLNPFNMMYAPSQNPLATSLPVSSPITSQSNAYSDMLTAQIFLNNNPTIMHQPASLPTLSSTVMADSPTDTASGSLESPSLQVLWQQYEQQQQAATPSATDQTMQMHALLQLQMHAQAQQPQQLLRDDAFSTSSHSFSAGGEDASPTNTSMTTRSIGNGAMSSYGHGAGLPTLGGISPMQTSLPAMPPPRIDRVVPSEGPMHGGLEITVLGSGFYPGLTLLFGDTPALPTHYWSPSTLVCLLPPSPTPGSVPVTFKEHSSSGAAGVDASRGQQLPALFTYIGSTDRALMELALQVVGLRMTGQLEEAHRIAMRIVGENGMSGDAGGSSTSPSSTAMTESEDGAVMHGVVLAADALALRRRQIAVGDNAPPVDLESTVLESLRVLDVLEGDDAADISMQSSSQHTMLHLAALLGLPRLSQFLIAHHIDIGAQDCHGFTALHFAAWAGQREIVQQLIDADAGVELHTNSSLTALELAQLREHTDCVELLHQHKLHSIAESSSEEDAEDAAYKGVEEDGEEEEPVSRPSSPLVSSTSDTREVIAAPLVASAVVPSGPPPPYSPYTPAAGHTANTVYNAQYSGEKEKAASNGNTEVKQPEQAKQQLDQLTWLQRLVGLVAPEKEAQPATAATAEPRFPIGVQVWRALATWTYPTPAADPVLEPAPHAPGAFMRQEVMRKQFEKQQQQQQHGPAPDPRIVGSSNWQPATTAAASPGALNQQPQRDTWPNTAYRPGDEVAQAMQRTLTCEEHADVTFTPRTNTHMTRRHRRRRDRIIFLFWVPIILGLFALALFRFIVTDEQLRDRVFDIVKQGVGNQP